MKYLVMGAGALGSVFGGMLAEHGHDVTFVGADDHLLAMREQGLTITGIWGEHHVHPVKAHYKTEGLEGVFDVVLLCVKSYHTATVIAQTAPYLHESSLVFSIQNGLGNWEIIADAVGWDRTVGARVIFGAEVPRPGTARVTVYADKVLLGSPSGTAPKDKIDTVRSHLDSAGIPCSVTDDIESSLWGKVLYNCSLNALGAILNVPYGELSETPALMDMIRRVIGEIFEVARAKGVKLPYAHAGEYFRVLTEVQLPPTASHRSSMLQDLSRGSLLTEIDALNGAISRYGRELGVMTPANDFLTAIVKGLEHRASTRHASR
ncbi:MAG TPA: ketopantoate reductase family protein [Deltaproteobacteria bacterium]|nr:ketopantoate reductase family protein [Deltaproteobacteria bacterium]HOM28811.1 ketopantoate reductase family protein [Deltaproteobacteria bacterium]HPP79543.1 ketopantoate reductase family protein [Deltaproteobacteria bacterium]